MGRLIEKVRILPVELRHDRPFRLMIDEGIQQELRSPADVMHMRELREGDIRLPLQRHSMAKGRIGDPIHRRHADDRPGQ
jgi:hypothetical protein